jgi:glycine oxidase
MVDVGYDQSIDEGGLRRIHEGAARLVPALADRRPIERWAGLRPISADSQPVLGPDPELDGLLYATGYGRDGIVIAPLAAEIVADLAVSGTSEFDWRPFRPDRFEDGAG